MYKILESLIFFQETIGGFPFLMVTSSQLVSLRLTTLYYTTLYTHIFEYSITLVIFGYFFPTKKKLCTITPLTEGFNFIYFNLETNCELYFNMDIS